MSPQRKGSKRGSGWKRPRDRREIVIAVLASLTVVVVTMALVWFLRPNRDSGSPTVLTVPASAPTTVAPTTAPPTTAPTESSTP